MARGVLTLGTAQAIAVLAAALATLGYGRWLAPELLAAWAMALSAARLALLLLDGGLKTALVRSHAWPDSAALHRLRRRMGRLSMGAAAAIAALGLAAAAGQLAAPQALLLVAGYPLCYLLTWPATFAALAALERAGHFAAIGRAEGASTLLEFVLPAGLMALGLPAAAAFVGSALLGRGLRGWWLYQAAQTAAGHQAAAASACHQAAAANARHDAAHAAAPCQAAQAAAALRDGHGPAGQARAADAQASRLWRQGLGVQAIAALSMLRDQMHLWLLAPLHGAAWAGAYALGATACALLSQAAVQTAGRVALPILRERPSDQRWPLVLEQTRWLAIATLPPLMLLPAWVGWIDQQLWQGRWQASLLPILPWLVARMVPGVATTVLGAWLLAAHSPRRVAAWHARWTLLELLAAAALLVMLGPIGLAVSGAVVVWCGLVGFLAVAEPAAPLRPRLAQLLGALLLRPSLGIAFALALLAWLQPAALLVATASLPLAWCSEWRVRVKLGHAWGRRQRLPLARGSRAMGP